MFTVYLNRKRWKKMYKKRKFLQVYNIYKKKINNNSRKLEIVRLSVRG